MKIKAFIDVYGLERGVKEAIPFFVNEVWRASAEGVVSAAKESAPDIIFPYLLRLAKERRDRWPFVDTRFVYHIVSRMRPYITASHAPALARLLGVLGIWAERDLFAAQLIVDCLGQVGTAAQIPALKQYARRIAHAPGKEFEQREVWDAICEMRYRPAN